MMNDKETFEEKCYRAYQLHWMLSHGYSLLDLKEILTGLAVEDMEEDPLKSMTAETSIRAEADCVTERFLYDVGFDGSLYVCKDEFLGAEYQNEGYMRMLTGLMPDPEKMFALWLKYSGVENPSPLETDQVLTIRTCHVDKETAEGLDCKSSGAYGLVVYPKGEYGWWVYIPEKWEDFGDGIPWDVFRDRLPKCLADCIDLAVRNNCRWLCLDGDGNTVDLPEYDW